MLADYFSFGCVLAFIFLDGKHLFSVMTIKDYYEGKFDLAKALEPIGDPSIIDVITRLLSLKPEDRLCAFHDIATIMPKSFAEL